MRHLPSAAGDFIGTRTAKIMVIHSKKTAVHWNYFLAIEEDLDRISRFVEFDTRNFECFSIEIARVLLASAAEVDVVCSQICKSLNPDSKAKSINQYRTEILQSYPDIPRFQVLLVKHGLDLTPWSNWDSPNGVPTWWTAYNKIKHHRDSEYQRANLKNVVNAVAGLFVMVLYLYIEMAEQGLLLPNPRLLRPSEERIGGYAVGADDFGINYLLSNLC